MDDRRTDGWMDDHHFICDFFNIVLTENNPYGPINNNPWSHVTSFSLISYT